MNGEGRWAKYRIPDVVAGGTPAKAAVLTDVEDSAISLSGARKSVGNYVRQVPEHRKPVGYDREFLDNYRPNVSSYLTERDRAHSAAVGRPQIAEQPAGTYAKQILSRLPIDLAWNSSRLEGLHVAHLTLPCRASGSWVAEQTRLKKQVAMHVTHVDATVQGLVAVFSRTKLDLGEPYAERTERRAFLRAERTLCVRRADQLVIVPRILALSPRLHREQIHRVRHAPVGTDFVSGLLSPLPNCPATSVRLPCRA
jgi:hypothetical protein